MKPARNRWYAFAVAILLLGTMTSLWFAGDADVIPESRADLRWSWLRRSPAGEPAVTVHDDSFVSLRRTGCFGECPIYRVTVFGSGRVEYVGRHYVCAIGPRTAVIDRRAASKLISDLETAGYFEIDWQPGNSWTDDSSAITRLSTPRMARTILDYHGDEGVPGLMRRFEDAIDEVAGTDRWMPQYQHARGICIAEDGTRRWAIDM